MLSLEIASILPFHWGFAHELHEDPNFASITLYEEVVDLVDVVRLRDEHDKFLLFLRLDRFIQFLNTSSIVIGLEFVFSNLCLTVSVNFLFFVSPGEVLICSLSKLSLWVSWPLETCEPSEQTTGLSVLSRLTDDDRQDDRPSSSEWSARLRRASRSVLPMVTSSLSKSPGNRCSLVDSWVNST